MPASSPGTRPTMADLVARVRDLIGDVPPSSITFEDWQVQDALDGQTARLDVNISDYRALIPHYAPVTGAYQWSEYYDPSRYGDWESDATLYNASLTLLSPTSSDYLTGHWSFAPGTQAPPVYVVGKTYDIYAAARVLALQWAARLARVYDVGADGTTLRRSQMSASLRELADVFAARVRPRSAHLVRRDVRGGW